MSNNRPKPDLSIISSIPLWFPFRFVSAQFWNLQVPPHSYAGKTVIVTGASGGLGLEAARHFAHRGAAKVILGCRSLERGKDARDDIVASLGASKSSGSSDDRKCILDVWQVDLGSYESVQQFCSRAAADLDRLDVLVESAALATSKYEVLEGQESCVTINVISTVLMALLLLPHMQKTGVRFNVVPHLTVVASDGHFLAKFPERFEADIFACLSRRDTMSPDRYVLTKLLIVLAMRQLVVELDGGKNAGSSPAVVVNTLNPGLCRSELFRNAPSHLSFIVNTVLWLLGRTCEMGSRNYVFAAQAGAESHGAYIDSCEIIDHSPWVTSEDGQKTQKEVFSQLKLVLEKIQPGITNVLEQRKT